MKMLRLLPLAFVAVALSAQTPPASPDLQTPPAVDLALRARVSEFLHYHVTAEFRKAEALVAEDSKDVFYNRPKPHYLSCKGIAWIRYSENFTHAYVTALCSLPTMIMPNDNEQQNDGQPTSLTGPPPLPIPMTWKIEDGKWCWYLDRELDRRSPFGILPAAPASTPQPLNSVLPLIGTPPGMTIPQPPPGFGTPTPAAPPAGASDPAMIAAIQAAGRSIPMTEASIGKVDPARLNHVKLESNEISLQPEVAAKLKITNEADDARVLMVMGGLPGLEAKLAGTNLNGGESTTLNLKAGKDAKSGTLNLVVVSTGEMLPVKITIE